jgi:hypothetical protein
MKCAMPPAMTKNPIDLPGGSELRTETGIGDTP